MEDSFFVNLDLEKQQRLINKQIKISTKPLLFKSPKSLVERKHFL